MNAKPNPRTPPRRSPKLARTEVETIQRRRIEQFRALAAITEMLPRSEDHDGRATGTLRVAELAARAGISNKAASRSLNHWREWRVLWLFWKGGRVWDARFERAVVESLLATWTTSPRGVGQLLVKHRKQRESLVPRPVPKTPPTFAPSPSSQVAETAGAGRTC
jgi:hypothetical protein